MPNISVIIFHKLHNESRSCRCAHTQNVEAYERGENENNNGGDNNTNDDDNNTNDDTDDKINDSTNDSTNGTNDNDGKDLVIAVPLLLVRS